MREYFRSIAVMCTPKQHQHKVQPVLHGLLSRPLFIGIAASIALLVVAGGGRYVVANGTTGLLRGLHLQ